MGNIPGRVSVNIAALESFRVSFKSFATSERNRLNKDKQFLENLNISDVQQVVSSTIGTAVQLANKEIESLLRDS